MSELPKWAEALEQPRVILLVTRMLVAPLSSAILTLGKVQTEVFNGIVLNLWISLKRNDMFIILSFSIHEHVIFLNLVVFSSFLWNFTVFSVEILNIFG